MLSEGIVRLGEKCSALYCTCASSVHIFAVSDSYCPRTVVSQWLARVKSQFYWPWKSGNVHTFCRTCTQCTRRKVPTKNNRAPMQAMVARYPLQRFGMDILGPLQKTPSRNRCVLVLMDNFYKWTAAFPLANMEANTVAKRNLAPRTIYPATMAAHLKRRWCWRCASCLSLRRRDNSHTTHKGMYRQRGLPARSLTCCPSCAIGTQASEKRSRESGSDSCDRHAWSRVAVAAGCSDQAPSLVQSPRATGLHPRDLRAYRRCARAGVRPPEDAATSPKVPPRPTRQEVTLQPERPHVACDATKR
ncbi:Retrovirus-related Pol polyprotein from transposon [Trichinella sp. T8]|nr:Retrovirus-related Pol polyprotein from transposon [Trichinella sp. T8]